MNKIKKLCLIILASVFMFALLCAIDVIAERTKVTVNAEHEMTVSEELISGGVMPLADMINVEPIVFTLDEGVCDAERTVTSYGEDVILTGVFTNIEHLLTFSPFLTDSVSSDSEAYTISGIYIDSATSSQGSSSIRSLPKKLGISTSRTYIFTFTLKRGYCWNNGSTNSFTLTVNTNLREVELPLPNDIKGGSGTQSDPYFIETVYSGTSPEIKLIGFDSDWVSVVNCGIYGEYSPLVDNDNKTVTVKRDGDRVNVCDNDKSSSFFIQPKFSEVVFIDDYSGNYSGQNCPVYFCIEVIPLPVDIPVLEGVQGGKGTESDPFYALHIYDKTVPAMTIQGIEAKVIEIESAGFSSTLTDCPTISFSTGNANVYDYATDSDKRFVKMLPKGLGSTDNYAWSDGSSDALYYTINTVVREIDYPEIIVSGSGSPANPVYTGKEIAFEIIDWEILSPYLDFADGSDGLVQTDIGIYSVTLKIKYEVRGNVTWSDGSTGVCRLSFEIIEEEPVPAIKIEPPVFVESEKTFSGAAVTFEIADWETLSQYLEIADGSDSLTQTNAGTFKITFKFKNGVNASWIDGSTDNYSLTFTIKENSAEQPIEPDLPPVAEITGFVLNDLSYGETVNPMATSSHGEVQFTYSTERNGVFTEIAPKNTGTYYVKASVSDGDGYLGAYEIISFKILPRAITVTINNAASVCGAELKELTASVTSGSIIDGDQPYELSTDADKDVIGNYEITGRCTDGNYDITFIPAVYGVKDFVNIRDSSGNGEITLPGDVDFEFGLTRLEHDGGFSQLGGITARYLAQLWYVGDGGVRGDEFNDSLNCKLTINIPNEIIEAICSGDKINREEIVNRLRLYYLDADNKLVPIGNFNVVKRENGWFVAFSYNSKFCAQIVMNVNGVVKKSVERSSKLNWIWMLIGIGGAIVAGGGTVTLILIKKKKSVKNTNS